MGEARTERRGLAEGAELGGGGVGGDAPPLLVPVPVETAPLAGGRRGGGRGGEGESRTGLYGRHSGAGEGGVAGVTGLDGAGARAGVAGARSQERAAVGGRGYGEDGEGDMDGRDWVSASVACRTDRRRRLSASGQLISHGDISVWSAH